MSTDLFGIRVLEREGARVRFQVFLVYYDWDDVPGASKTFFFRVLHDRAPDASPLRRDVSTDQIGDDQWVTRHAADYVRHVALVSYTRPEVEERSTFYYERDGAWRDEENLIQAVFDVWARHASSLAHLEPGMAWGTTSYPCDDDSCIASAKDGPPVDLAGRTVVLTGRMSVSQAAARSILEQRGAILLSRVSATTDYVVVGTIGSRKYRDAHGFRIPLLDQDYLTTDPAASDWSATMAPGPPSGHPRVAPTAGGSQPGTARFGVPAAPMSTSAPAAGGSQPGTARPAGPGDDLPCVLLFRLPDVPIYDDLVTVADAGNRLDSFPFFIRHSAHRSSLMDRVPEQDGVLGREDIQRGVHIAQWCVSSCSALLQPLWLVKRSARGAEERYVAGFHLGGTMDAVREAFLADGYRVIEGADAFVRDGDADATELMARRLRQLLGDEAPDLAARLEAGGRRPPQ